MKFPTFYSLSRLILSATVFVTAQAGAADVGILTLNKGSVLVSGANQSAHPAISFMKLRKGDGIEVGEASKIQVLYTSNGRQETWNGPVRIEIGEQISTTLTQGTLPLVKQLPARVLAQLAKAPAVLSDIKGRTGMVMIRSSSLLEQLREVDETYKQMRANADDDDVAPELYLVSALYEMKLYKDVLITLEDILKKQPDNAEAKALAEHMASLMRRHRPAQAQ